MVGASGDDGDGVFTERQCWDTNGGDYRRLIGTVGLSGSGAGLTETVQTPGPDIFFIYLNCKGMVNPTADKSVFLIQPQRSWDQRVVALSLGNTMAELILLAGSPDEYFAILPKSYGMVSAANKLFDITEIW